MGEGSKSSSSAGKSSKKRSLEKADNNKSSKSTKSDAGGGGAAKGPAKKARGEEASSKEQSKAAGDVKKGSSGGGSRQSTRRALRAAIARYSRIGASALGAVQRAKVLLKRVEAQTQSVALILATTSLENDSLQRANVAAAQRYLAQQQLREERRAPSASEISLRVDELGRAVDADGNLVIKADGGAKGQKTLRANEKIEQLAALKAKKPNPYTSHRVVETADQMDVIDKRVKPKKREGKKTRAFAFIEEGHYTKIADATRARANGERMSSIVADKRRGMILEVDEEALAAEVTAGSRQEGEEGDGQGASVGGCSGDEDEESGSDIEEPQQHVERDYDASATLPRRADHTSSIPGMEWWDEEFLDKNTRSKRLQSMAERIKDMYDLCTLEHSRFGTLVHHPAPVRSLAPEKKQATTAPFYLTKRDRKRIRRQTRAEREREKQDKIQLGLIPPPEPKFKLSNFMKVLGEQAVADPSKVEKKVMEQVNSRMNNHEMRNLARKLTPQEKKEKTRRKAAEDTTSSNGPEARVALFYVASLESSQHRYKIDVNARQLGLTGGVLMCTSPEAPINLVLVEGGPKSIKKFLGLMTRRVDWADSTDEKASSTLNGKPNWSKLVWEGTVIKRAFQAFRFQECKTTATARRVMEAKNVTHYWDMVRNVHEAGHDKATADETPLLAS